MNRILEFRNQDNAGGVAVQAMLHGSSNVVAYLSQKESPYNLSTVNAVMTLQPFLKERTNHRLQYLVLNRTCDNNYYRALIDVKGINRFDFFNIFSPYKTVEIATVSTGTTSTWANTLVETQLADKVELGLDLIAERLNKIAQLKFGWDSYSAEPIESATIARAIVFFSKIIVRLDKEKRSNSPVPFIAPLSDGGIQFEWRTFYKELTIVIPKSRQSDITYLKVEKDIFGETEEEGTFIVADDAVELATTWLLS